MTEYRIVCTVQEPYDHPKTDAHVVWVGTGGDQGWNKKWLLAEVLAAMDKGDRFYTIGKASKKRAEIEKYTCNPCKKTYIRSAADRVTDNNLDSLPTCKES